MTLKNRNPLTEEQLRYLDQFMLGFVKDKTFEEIMREIKDYTKKQTK